MAGFGKIVGQGITRIALSHEDKLGREQLIRWFGEEQCEVKIDAIGNIFAIRPGKRRELAPVLTGSHNDTQPNGGRFDGTLGVLAGLEILSVLNENNIELERDFIVVNWTNEEGTRFTPGCTGSGVWCGKLEREDMYALQDQTGTSLKQALQEIGFAGDAVGPSLPLHAAFELHVEQGPVLDKEKISIGIPEGIVSPHWYDIEIKGEANHAGSTPMSERRDPLQAFCRMAAEIRRLAVETEHLVATIGELHVNPNSRNVIPGQVRFTVDIRGWNQDATSRVCREVEQVITEISEEENCRVNIQQIWQEQRADFNPRLTKMVEESADKVGLSSKRMYSGASHDMLYINQVAPGAMIFVPSIGGKSHSPSEDTSYDDCAAGADVLLHCIVRTANEVDGRRGTIV